MEVNKKLSDFWATYTADDALCLVEKYPGEGFEAWRQFKQRYSPTGGRADMERGVRMMTRKPRKTLSDLPAAIDQLDRDLAYHDANAGYILPDGFRILLLIQLFPEDAARDLKIRYVSTAKDFYTTKDEILNFANTERLAETNRGIKPMDVDSIREEKWTTKEWMDWQQDQEAEADNNVETVDYMGKKSKGKGKGRNGGKGKGKSSKGKGKGEETRSCHWCLKTRHRIAECRSKAAGKPKAPRPLGASSIEPEEWKEDCRSLTFDCDVMGEESDEDQFPMGKMDGWKRATFRFPHQARQRTVR